MERDESNGKDATEKPSRYYVTCFMDAETCELTTSADVPTLAVARMMASHLLEQIVRQLSQAQAPQRSTIFPAGFVPRGQLPRGN